MDKSRIQILNKPEEILIVKGSGNIHGLTLAENCDMYLYSQNVTRSRENCCRPFLSWKGRIQKEVCDDMPPGFVSLAKTNKSGWKKQVECSASHLPELL